MPEADDTAADVAQEDEVVAKRRVLFTDTRWWSVDVDAETAAMLLEKGADICDIADEFTRIKRIDPHASPVEAGLTVEPASESFLFTDDLYTIDGTQPQSFYWSARAAVMDSRYHLNCGRYREGDCREMDAVNAKLARIEDELRLLAMAVDEARKEVDECPDCGHEPHGGAFCQGWSECDEDCGPHECACNHPDSGNYSEVPAREYIQ